MSSEKNLNECNGCLIINNDQNISVPANGKTNAYDINFEKPCFFVNNHYLTPLLKCYSVTLPNPVTLEANDELTVQIKIPKNIFGKKYGYSLDDLAAQLDANDQLNFSAGLRLKSSDGCRDFNSSIDSDITISANDYCGWIILEIKYTVPSLDSSMVCNLCEISYSLCFDPFKVKALYGKCDDHEEENVEFPMETCLLLKNGEEIE